MSRLGKYIRENSNVTDIIFGTYGNKDEN